MPSPILCAVAHFFFAEPAARTIRSIGMDIEEIRSHAWFRSCQFAVVCVYLPSEGSLLGCC